MTTTTTSTTTSTTNAAARARDDGMILPMALVVSVVMSIIVIGLAGYTTTALRYGQSVENRADRLSAAEAGLRHMLEQEQEAGGLCTTALGAGTGTTYDLPDTISGAAVSINCRQVGNTLSNITAWAVVITGEGGVPNGSGLVTSSGNGKTKVFGGPSYVARTGLLGIGADLEMRDGNLWYSQAGCKEGGQYVSATYAPQPNLSFAPASRGLWCTSKPWTDMFKEPTLGAVPAVTNPPFQDIGGCRVFEPGRYTVTPAWGANTYLKSGNYYFNTGLMPVKQITITAGREGVGASQQEIDNAPCDAIRDGDTPTGATLYFDGTTRFQMQTQGALEILRRQQGADLVAIHALPTHTLNYTTSIIGTDPGNKKQMAIQGLVWAPRTAIEFGEVTNVTAAQLTGGAVVASLRAAGSASITGFVIQVAGSPQSDKLQYTASATKEGNTTQVRVVTQARFSKPATGNGVGTWEFVVNSWRVCPQLC